MNYDAAILATANLVGYWKHGETSGTTLADSQGTNPLTLAGEYALDQAGATTLLGRSVLYNATGGTGYAEAPTAAALHPTAALTLEAWVKPSTLSGTYRNIAGCGNTGQTDPYVDYGFSISDANRFTFGLSIGSTQYPQLGPLILAGVWYYLVGTHDGTTIRFYVNGSQVASQAVTGSVRSSGQPFTVGRYHRGGAVGEYLPGAVQHVALYDAALSAATIEAHYNAAAAPMPVYAFPIFSSPVIRGI